MKNHDPANQPSTSTTQPVPRPVSMIPRYPVPIVVEGEQLRDPFASLKYEEKGYIRKLLRHKEKPEVRYIRNLEHNVQQLKMQLNKANQAKLNSKETQDIIKQQAKEIARLNSQYEEKCKQVYKLDESLQAALTRIKTVVLQGRAETNPIINRLRGELYRLRKKVSPQKEGEDGGEGTVKNKKTNIFTGEDCENHMKPLPHLCGNGSSEMAQVKHEEGGLEPELKPSDVASTSGTGSFGMVKVKQEEVDTMPEIDSTALKESNGSTNLKEPDPEPEYQPKYNVTLGQFIKTRTISEIEEFLMNLKEEIEDEESFGTNASVLKPQNPPSSS